MECKKCLMEGKGIVAGQAFTEFTCVKCGRIDRWHNTHTPKICDACSKRFNICQRCGKKLDEK